MMSNTDLHDRFVANIHKALAKASWIAFDLDDTLHEFRRASSAAIAQVLQIIEREYGIPLNKLQAEYTTILRQKTSSAFAEGKSSHEYREARFRALAENFSISMSDALVRELLQCYEETLMSNLQLKEGVPSLFRTIKSQDKKIAVITEGPQDAQERTVKQLGIAESIDFLATTNHFGVAKIDGLFPSVLRHLQIAPSDVVFVGDSQDRDMKPGQEAGLFCFHFVPYEAMDLDQTPPRIAKMGDLESLLHGSKR